MVLRVIGWREWKVSEVIEGVGFGGVVARLLEWMERRNSGCLNWECSVRKGEILDNQLGPFAEFV